MQQETLLKPVCLYTKNAFVMNCERMKKKNLKNSKIFFIYLPFLIIILL